MPDSFFDSAERPMFYEFPSATAATAATTATATTTATAATTIYCKSCADVVFYALDDPSPLWRVDGDGQIELPSGITVTIFRGRSGVARAISKKKMSEKME